MPSPEPEPAIESRPNALEVAILEHIAARAPELRAPLQELHVVSREYLGVGCLTDFVMTPVPGAAPQVLGFDGIVHVVGLEYGLGAVLFCMGTQPECLEIYSFDEPWDGSFEGFSISLEIDRSSTEAIDQESSGGEVAHERGTY
jgi:hypothetical protein